jgi:predicted RND superfamily exporter protein
MNSRQPTTRSNWTSALTVSLAAIIAHRTKALIALGIGIMAVALLVILTRHNLDSEVLDLLPGQFQSVAGLKEYNNEFSQARQIVFVFLAEEGHADDLGPFRDHFVSELSKQPWIERTFDQVPIETDEGLSEIQGVGALLLLNLPPEQFREAMSLLQPSAIEERFTRIRAMLNDALSVRSQVEVTMDPLGLLTRAMKPYASSSLTDSGGSFSLGSSDGLMQLAFATTNQPGLGTKDCQDTMDQLNAFQSRILREWNGYKPRVMVTGRTPFVAQISRSMDRDGTLSATFSILIVSGLFFLAFRRFFPLLGIVLILGLSALVSLALGMLIFRNLNMIAIGFCSILVGLGVDFSLLLFGRYLQARRTGGDHGQAVFVAVRDIGAAVFYVVVTTAIGFLVLGFSKSSGFAQLGVLVALGVAAAGLFMVLFLFMFFKPVKPAMKPDFILIGANRFVNAMFREPRPFLLTTTILLLGAALVALFPTIPLSFDTNPRSLQPKQIPASVALQEMADKLHQDSDPVTILVDSDDREIFHQRWEHLSEGLEKARAAGKIKSVSTLSMLAFSPKRFAENRAYLKNLDFAQIESDLKSILEKNGFDLTAFRNAFELLQSLERQKGASGLPAWDTLFPQKSSWWFLVEHYFSNPPTRAAGYVQPVHPIKTAAEQKEVADLIHQLDPEAKVTGWSFTVFDLVPWAQGELVAFTTIVGVAILILLGVVYRKLSLWLVHASALLLSMLGLVASLKLLHLSVNLLNALAFPLVLAIGVDYGIQFLVVSRREGDLRENLVNVLKPLLICGLATLAGFAVLIPAENPALSGLGTVCALGVFWCLLTTFFYMVPAFAYLQRGIERSNGVSAYRRNGVAAK